MSEDLYWRLHGLSKHMESSGRIDEHEYPSAYATILDAMSAVREAEKLHMTCAELKMQGKPFGVIRDPTDRADAQPATPPKVTATVTTVLPDGVSSRTLFETPLTVLRDEVLELDYNNQTARVIPSKDSTARMMRRIEKRDRRIAGMQRRIGALERALATQGLDMQRLPRDVTRAVQEALCNVRMIPVRGLGGSTKIVEVRTTDEEVTSTAEIAAALGASRVGKGL